MITAIVQARMTSSRLPGKVMMRIMGKPMIGYLIDRLKRSQRVNQIVVATPIDPINDEMCRYLEEEKVAVFRGSEHDVLERFYQAALVHFAEIVVRITADCPLIDSEIVDLVIDRHVNSGADYTSNTQPRSFPDGQDVEVMHFATLERAWKEAKDPADREHVTRYIWRNKELFQLKSVISDADLSRHRWTLDYPEDFEVVRTIINALYPMNQAFGMEDILKFLKSRPEVEEFNRRHIVINDGVYRKVNL